MKFPEVPVARDWKTSAKLISDTDKLLTTIDTGINGLYENKYENYVITGIGDHIIWTNCNTVSVYCKTGSFVLKEPIRAGSILNYAVGEYFIDGGYVNAISRDRIVITLSSIADVIYVKKHWAVAIMPDASTILNLVAANVSNLDLTIERVDRWKDLSANFLDTINSSVNGFIIYNSVNPSVRLVKNPFNVFPELNFVKPLSFIIDGTNEITIDLKFATLSFIDSGVSKIVFSEFIKFIGDDETITGIEIIIDKKGNAIYVQLADRGLDLVSLKIVFRKKSIVDSGSLSILDVYAEALDGTIYTTQITYSPFVFHSSFVGFTGDDVIMELNQFKISKS